MTIYRLGKDFVLDTDLVEPGSTQAYTRRPERTIQDVLEARSARLARFLDETPGAAKAVAKLVAAISHYAQRHGVSPREIVVRDAQVHTGTGGARFVAFLDRRPPPRRPGPRRRRRSA